MAQIQWHGDKLDDPAIVVVDLGNNYLKAYAYISEGNRVYNDARSIPHGYIQLSETEWRMAEKAAKRSRGRASETHTFQIARGDSASDPDLLPVTIGAGAMLSPKNSPLLGTNKYIRGGIDALLCAVLMEFFPPDRYPKGHNNLIIGYGFPPTEWQQTEHIGEIMHRTHRVVTPDGQKMSYRVRASVAWDENVGGLVNAMGMYSNRNPGNGRFQKALFEPGDRVIVFDSGGWLGSMAWATINGLGFAEMDYTSDIASIDGGAITVRKALRQALKEHFEELRGARDRDLQDDMLDETLRTGHFVLSGDKEHPRDARAAIADSLSYIGLVREPYINMFANGRFADHILMTGGTVHPLYDYLLELFQHNSVHLAGRREKIYQANAEGGMAIVLDRLVADGIMPEIFKRAMERKS